MEMKHLGNLKPAPGSHRSTKRLGRGPGSGQGKTAGKGHKGQKARKGSGPRAGFEGGQTPLYRRLPKRGFSVQGKKVLFNIINLQDLSKFTDGQTVGKSELQAAGLLRNPRIPVKILGMGKIDRKLQLKIDRISRSALEAVQNAGGTVELNAPKG
ncbi:MAG: 50S ribosomal protein L15 [Oligoflexales bacterium]